MNCLNYLIKNDINTEIDKIIDESLILFKSQDGQKCLKCGVIQGNSSKGFTKYYCKHLTFKIDGKLKEKKRKITNKTFRFVAMTTLQDKQLKE